MSVGASFVARLASLLGCLALGCMPSCACLADEPCADQCSDAGNGWLKLSCIK